MSSDARSVCPQPKAVLRSDAVRRADFTGLVRENLAFIWRLLRRLGLSSADAEDAAQQVFMIAARRADDIPAGSERTFLYGAALRVAANARRGARRRREVDDAEAPTVETSSAWDPDRQLEVRRARSLLDELLAKMPPELARVLVLAEVEQLTVVAIAELEGIPEGTAASRLRRARAQFRELLSLANDKNPFGAGRP